MCGVREEGGDCRQEMILLPPKSAAPHSLRVYRVRFCEHCSRIKTTIKMSVTVSWTRHGARVRCWTGQIRAGSFLHKHKVLLRLVS
jgi:hypothetical protein